MTRQIMDPVLRAAVRDQLEHLSSRTRPSARPDSGRTASVQASPNRSLRTLLVTTGPAIAIVGGSFAAIQFGQSRAVTAANESGTQITANSVTFDGSAAQAAQHERDLKAFLERAGFGQTTPDRSVAEAIRASPELRYDATPVVSQGFAVVGSADGGTDTNAEADAGWFRYSDENGYYGTGQSPVTGKARIESFVMNCPGSGTYTWTLQGRTASETRDRTLVRTTGRCGSKLTTTRYRLDPGTRTTSFSVTVNNHGGGIYNAAIYRWLPTDPTR